MDSVISNLTNWFRWSHSKDRAANNAAPRFGRSRRPPTLVLDANANIDRRAQADEQAGAVVIRSANDPDFSAKRNAAEETLRQAITQVLTSGGFRYDGKMWVRFGRNGAMTFSLARSRWGYDTKIELHFAPGRMVRKHQLWFDQNPLALGQFFLPEEDLRSEPGRLHYLSIADGTNHLDAAMAILKTRVLPFVEEHLNGAGKKAVADFAQVGAQQPGQPTVS